MKKMHKKIPITSKNLTGMTMDTIINAPNHPYMMSQINSVYRCGMIDDLFVSQDSRTVASPKHPKEKNR